ncbi:MAG TPA: SIMPL domain-containing protein [Anaerolineae bacterium]|nr:SIMPL domain-containing protein [Anaerolineae bacterium]
MKDRLAAIAAGAALLVLVLAAWKGKAAPTVQGSDALRTVSVTGEAEVRVVPDEVVLTLGIATHDNQIAVAKSQNDAIVQRVLALATEYDIPPEHVQTDYVGIEPRYPNGCYELCDPIGFAVRRSVVLRLRELDKFEDLLTDSLNAGVNYVHGIEFRTTELRKYRDEARALAIGAAEEKAGALAGELGQKAGRPQTITEQQSSWWSGYGAWWGSSWGSAMTQNTIQEYGGAPLGVDSSVAPGQISVRASVAVSFELTD